MTPNLDFFEATKLDTRLPKTTQIYELMRNAIIAMELAPGVTIQEREICGRLDVSRTPLREAILQLATERLVVVKPGGGTFVNAIDMNEVLAGQIARDTLEVRLTQLAARRFTPARAKDFELSLFRQGEAAKRRDVEEFFALDVAFHKLICDASGMSNSWRLLHAATGQLDRVRRLAFPIEKNFDVVVAEHAAIYQAIKAKDEKAAVAALRDQLDGIFKTAHLVRQQRPDLFAMHSDIGINDIR